MAVIEELKASAPAPTKSKKSAKNDQSHVALIAALEERIEKIDSELAVSLLCYSPSPRHILQQHP
jgi:hypothetical protein